MTEAEKIRQLKTEAKEHFDAIKGAELSRSRCSMTIGYHAYRMKQKGLFQVIGFTDEDAAREAAGVGESTWYAMIALAEKYEPLTEKQFTSMKQANAKAMMDLPESKRHSGEWIRAAAVDPMKVFKEKVDEELNGKAKPSDGKERSTVLKLDMPASRKTVIEEKAKVFAEQHGLEVGDVGRVVEMALIEATEGMTLINSITNAVQRIKKAKEVIHGNGLSADEVITQVETELDGMALDFEAALLNRENEAEVLT